MAFFYTFVNNIYKSKLNWSFTMEEMSQNPDQETLNYVFNQTMLRIKDPEKSIDFYTKVVEILSNNKNQRIAKYKSPYICI